MTVGGSSGRDSILGSMQKRSRGSRIREWGRGQNQFLNTVSKCEEAQEVWTLVTSVVAGAGTDENILPCWAQAYILSRFVARNTKNLEAELENKNGQRLVDVNLNVRRLALNNTEKKLIS